MITQLPTYWAAQPQGTTMGTIALVLAECLPNLLTMQNTIDHETEVFSALHKLEIEHEQLPRRIELGQAFSRKNHYRKQQEQM